jgi:NAD(P)H-flavin reductase
MANRAAKEVQPRAQSALSASPVFALRELRVDQQGERLIITGPVSSFYHKQLAQEVVLAVAEGIEVVNSIAVNERVTANR